MQPNVCAGKTPEENSAIQSYFNTLSPYLQENICQSGMQFSNVQELKACAEHIMQRSGPSNTPAADPRSTQ